MKLGYLDTETVSDIDIKQAGTIRYAEACGLLSIHVILPGSAQVRRYEPHLGPVPAWLDEALLDPETTWVAHNGMFDRTVVVEALGYYNLADPARWICTAALGRYAGLPGKLGQLGERLHLPEAKDTYGDQTGINLFTKRYSPKWRTPEQEPAEWAKFMAYGDQDTRMLPKLYKALGATLKGPAADHWVRRERDVFHWDQRINELGIPVDPAVLTSALAMVGRMKPRMARELSDLTGGELKAVGSPKLKDYLNSEFLMQLPNLRADDTLRPALDEDIPDRARQLIELRLQHKTSLAKYERMDLMMSPDQRVRAGFLYHGAHTGRWAGQGFQPQNLTRPGKDQLGEVLDPVEVADAIAEEKGDPDALAERFEAPIFEILTAGIRGAIHARPGKTLVIADYNQIESRMTSWLAGCSRKLNAFREHDHGLSEFDVYEVTAQDVLGVQGKPTEHQRFEGKTMDLGLGFGMGAVKFAHVAGIPFIRARDLVFGWRDAYAEIPMSWRDAADGFAQAIRSGSSNQFPVRRDKVSKLGVMTLPNGKPLFYHGLRYTTWRECLAHAALYGRLADARERMSEKAGLDPDNPEHLRRFNTFQTCYLGQYGNRRMSHGGLYVENRVQGSAREVMVTHGLQVWHERGLLPCLQSHDEMVFELPIAEAQAFADWLGDLMAVTPAEFLGLPLKAEVKISRRYTK